MSPETGPAEPNGPPPRRASGSRGRCAAPCVGPAGRQAVDGLAGGGRLPHACRLRVRGGHPVRGLRARRVHPALAGLGHHAQGGRDRAVREDLRGVFAPPPVAAQAIRPRVRHDLVEARLMALRPQARATLGQHARHGHAARQGPVAPGPQGDLDLGGGHDFASREVLMKRPPRALDQPPGVFRRAPQRWAGAVGEAVPPRLTIAAALDPTPRVVRGHQGVQDPRVDLGRFGGIALFQQARPPSRLAGDMRDAGAPSGKLFQHSQRGGRGDLQGRHGMPKKLF